MRYCSHYESLCTSAYIRTCSVHKHYECLNGVWSTVMSSATICVRYSLCVVSCEGQSLSPISTLSCPLLHHLPSRRPPRPQQDKRFSLSPSLFVSFYPLISLCHRLLHPPSPLHLVRLVSPLLSTSFPLSIILSVLPSAPSLLSTTRADSYLTAI